LDPQGVLGRAAGRRRWLALVERHAGPRDDESAAPSVAALAALGRGVVDLARDGVRERERVRERLLERALVPAVDPVRRLLEAQRGLAIVSVDMFVEQATPSAPSTA